MVFCIDLYTVKVDRMHTNVVQDISKKNRLSAGLSKCENAKHTYTTYEISYLFVSLNTDCSKM